MTSAMILSLLTSAAMSVPQPALIDSAQGVAYQIEASLDETTDVLTGRAILRYTNNAAQAVDTLYFHQHLNAFRPHSAWAIEEAMHGERRFQRVGRDQHAFERLTYVAIDGLRVVPIYPGVPDSTVVAVPLHESLATGATVEVRLDWESRLSMTPRRQGREGRHYDWAHWYPRIAVFNADGWHFQPLMPQGEFWGEFASYDVTLEIDADQVLAATGVPVEGDPGWERAMVAGEIHTREKPYTRRESLGLLKEEPSPGRKRVRWHAADVIHFAWSADPEFRYEGGLWRDVPVHVLFRPQSTETWGNGIALERTFAALDWTNHLFGDYAYPQLTNAERLERGGTEFPMLIMNGSASEGLIVHEVLHQYAHAILANNEWRDGWLDEGLTDFLTSRYFEEQGNTRIWEQSLAAARQRERLGATQPIATPGAEFRDFQTYQAMTYTKAALVFRMLEGIVGPEPMVEILRHYYARNRLSHVDEPAFRAAVVEVTGSNYDWFFDQWLHTTARLDYGITEATTQRLPDGRWSTAITVVRAGDAWMPVELQVGDVVQTLESGDRQQVSEVVTKERPHTAVLDPRDLLLDYDPTNNRRVVR